MKVLFNLILPFALSTILFSCDGKKVTENTCDLESMKCYRGYPQSCKFIEKCNEVEHHFTKHLCSQAFNEFFKGGSQKALLEKYSTKILHCFNDREFENFNIDKSLRPKE